METRNALSREKELFSNAMVGKQRPTGSLDFSSISIDKGKKEKFLARSTFTCYVTISKSVFFQDTQILR